MKKLYFFILLLCLGTQFLHSQNNYSYYYKDKKIPLVLSKSTINVIADESFDTASLDGFGFKEFSWIEKDSVKYAILEYTTEPTDIEFYQKLNALKSNPKINHVNLYFDRGENVPPIGISNVFYIKLKSIDNYNLLVENAVAVGARIVKEVPYMPLWYQLELNPRTTETTLTATSFLWETRHFENIDPGFMFDFSPDSEETQFSTPIPPTTTCANDPNFSVLWGFNNTVNPTIDINACQAWTISEGQGVKVAVVDGSGIELTHNDLAANIHPLSFNMETGNSPSVVTTDYDHSTHIAGTIAAVKNNNL